MQQEMERPHTQCLSVAAPRILNMAAQFVKRGHNVDQLSTIGSVFVKNNPQDKQCIQNAHYHYSEIIPPVPTPSSFTSCVQYEVKIHYTIGRNLSPPPLPFCMILQYWSGWFSN